MTDIVERLRSWCTDWNGAAMVRGEPPRDGLHCDDLLDAADEIGRLERDVENANFAMCHANDVAMNVRAATIEECAQIVDRIMEGTAFAAAIRALKEQRG